MTAAWAAPNLVTNGSFETSTPANTSGEIGGTDSSGNPISVSGWSISSSPGYSLIVEHPSDITGSPGVYESRYGGDIRLWDATNNSGAGGATMGVSPDGGAFVAMDGDSTINGNSALQQTLSGLTPGGAYDVSFYWAAAQQYGYTGNTTEAWQVSLGSSTAETSVYSLPSQTFSGWMQYSHTFVATSSSEVLSFLAIGTPSTGASPPFALIDGTSFSVHAPEVNASTAAVPLAFMAGLLLLVLDRRRKGQIERQVAGSTAE